MNVNLTRSYLSIFFLVQSEEAPQMPMALQEIKKKAGGDEQRQAELRAKLRTEKMDFDTTKRLTEMKQKLRSSKVEKKLPGNLDDSPGLANSLETRRKKTSVSLVIYLCSQNNNSESTTND